MAGAFYRPDASADCIPLREPQRLLVPARIRSDRPLRDDRTSRRGNNRQHVLIALRVDAHHVIHLVCDHLVRSSGSAHRVR